MPRMGLLLKISTVFLVLFYLTSLVLQFLSFNFDSNLGYLDPQLFWQGLSDLLSGKVIYRNFYWSSVFYIC